MTVYLIRHGRTRGNLERRYTGSTDEPLCPEGRAELAGRRAPAADQLWTSPMLRCRQTAELLFPGRTLRVAAGLRECSFGAFEGRTYGELKDDPAYRRWLDSGGALPPPGGESRPQQQERTLRAFYGIVGEAPPGTAVALVVHGGTIMCLLEALEPGGEFYRWQAPNGGGFRCRWDGKNLSVIEKL